MTYLILANDAVCDIIDDMSRIKGSKHKKNPVLNSEEYAKKLRSLIGKTTIYNHAEYEVVRALETLVAYRDGHGPANPLGKAIARLNRALDLLEIKSQKIA